jgi:hypothetical protein
MTRTAAWLGALLGAFLVFHGLGMGGIPNLISRGVAIGLGLITWLSAVRTVQGSGAAALVLAGVSLVVLGWQLPRYFTSYDPWPALVLVGLASGTFGVGLAGYLIDRHPGRTDPPGGRL